MRGDGIRKLTFLTLGQELFHETHYILMPYGMLLRGVRSLAGLTSLLVFLSLNLVVVVVMVPAYVMLAYFYFVFWRTVKRFDIRLFPFLICITPMALISVFAAISLRGLIVTIWF